jgi:hypothetical protein
MPIKRNDTYEYREVVKRPDLSVTLLEIGTCKEDVLFEQLKKPVNGRFYHTEDTNRFFFDFKGKRFELNLIGGGGGEPIDLREYAKKKDIPTKLSQLRNDSDFVTITTVGTFLKQHDYITEDDLIESISDFVKKKDIDEINKKQANVWFFIVLFVDEKNEFLPINNSKKVYRKDVWIVFDKVLDDWGML